MPNVPGLFVGRSVRQTLETAHREYNQGVWENNPAHILAFYEKWTTPDFEEQDNSKGQVTTRAEMLALMEKVVSLGSFDVVGTVLEASSRIAKLVIKPDCAVAVMTNKYRYSQIDVQGWHGPKDAEHEIETAGRWRETWVKTEEGWRLRVNQMMSNQTYVDGVLFAPNE